MSYKSVLPEVFPFLLQTDPHAVVYFVTKLMDPTRKDVPQGSSFAVTVDNWNGTWNLWLSEASYNFLKSVVKEPLPITKVN